MTVSTGDISEDCVELEMTAMDTGETCILCDIDIFQVVKQNRNAVII